MSVFGKLKNENENIVSKTYFMFFVGLCNNINSTYKKYNNGYINIIPVPKSNLKEVKDYDNLTAYLASNKKWVKVDKMFKKLREEKIDMIQYLSVLLENWFRVKNILGITSKEFQPNFNILFSDKLIPVYCSIKNIEIKEDIERKKDFVVKDTKPERINKTFGADYNSLFRIKALNSDLGFHDIVSIFIGEFDKEFAELILKEREELITKEYLKKKLGLS